MVGAPLDRPRPRLLLHPRDPSPRHPARACLRLCLEPRVLLQAPRRLRRSAGRHQAPAAPGAPAEHHGVMLGAASGVLFGVSDVAIKALTGLVGLHGALGLASPWFVVALAASIVAFYASARGLQDGEAVPVIAITGTAANISCIAGGILVFGDPMPGDALGIAVQGMAFVMVVVASALTPAPVRAARVATA